MTHYIRFPDAVTGMKALGFFSDKGLAVLDPTITAWRAIK